MRSVVKGVLFGSAAGAGLAAVRQVMGGESQEGQEGQEDDVARRVAMAAAGGAFAGALVGLVMERRARRRLAVKGAKLASVVTVARAARPVVERTRDTASKAAEAARPRVEQVAEVAKEQAGRLAEAARPLAETVRPWWEQVAESDAAGRLTGVAGRLPGVAVAR